MNPLVQFTIYNLAASLAAGWLAWVAVRLVLRLLRAPNAFLYTSFLALPLAKSILILLGVGIILPWTGFLSLSSQALPAGQIWPFIVIWFLVTWAIYRLLGWLVQQNVIRKARLPEGAHLHRLNNTLEQVIQAYKQAACCEAGETVCCISDQIPTVVQLFVSDDLSSPLSLLNDRQPVIIFPSGLLDIFDDKELSLALAHELNHFALRKPGRLWSAGNIRLVALVSPIAFLLSDSLHQEEEKACDDLAIRILGSPGIYAGMLMKSYQFSRHQSRTRWQTEFLPQLVGAKPFFSKRVERILPKADPRKPWIQSSVITWSVWVLLLYLLFFAHFGS